MRVTFKRDARKSLGRLPRDRQRQIVERIEAVAGDPNSRTLDVEPLAGSHLRRLRVGQYRVLFRIDGAQNVLIAECADHRVDPHAG